MHGMSWAGSQLWQHRHRGTPCYNAAREPTQSPCHAPRSHPHRAIARRQPARPGCLCGDCAGPRWRAGLVADEAGHTSGRAGSRPFRALRCAPLNASLRSAILRPRPPAYSQTPRAWTCSSLRCAPFRARVYISWSQESPAPLRCAARLTAPLRSASVHFDVAHLLPPMGCFAWRSLGNLTVATLRV